jgi:hypothetical protein
MSSYALALAHYRLQFPDEASLGTGDPPTAWKTEYDAVVAGGGAFDPVLLTSGSFEGGQGSGIRNFDQGVLLRALHARRHELDDDYQGLDTSRPMGITVLLGGGGRSC